MPNSATARKAAQTRRELKIKERAYSRQGYDHDTAVAKARKDLGLKLSSSQAALARSSSPTAPPTPATPAPSTPAPSAPATPSSGAAGTAATSAVAAGIAARLAQVQTAPE